MRSSDSFLVDFTAAMVRRRRLFAIIFLFVLLLGAGYQLAIEPRYQYVSLVKLAQNGEGSLLEPADGLIATLESQWLPDVSQELRKDHGYALKFRVTVSEVKGGYIKLSSVGSVKKSDEIRRTHSAIIERLEESQLVLERHERNMLESQIESAERAIKSFMEGSGSSNGRGSGLFEVLVSLQGKLAGMRSAETRVIARQSNEERGLGLTTRIALVVLQALFLAVVGVTVLYFAQHVRCALKEQSDTVS
ncbi:MULTISPECIES: hypothetical protein [Marinobacter]|jgi:hypothetical protein|uniref:Lipopolysaccharide biosynthesis n=1 Tax=Marinobacter excellens LAMA 842 TaxID=1306954 RepID=A0A137S1Y5_9GAMM|nr:MULTISPECIES: hypothetical protein [Marinobacter]KXO06424.1 lipopolysaccharide biosynthesis [Marinobacter excellens LAMA 842]MCD1630769.1 hypothetical protein [Marinobacter shengliensis]